MKYAISKPLLDPLLLARRREELDWARIEANYQYRVETMPDSLPEVSKYFDSDPNSGINDPFAFTHGK